MIYNLPKSYFKPIYFYLTEWRIQDGVDSVVSRTVESGVPQGSVLFPTLYVADLLPRVNITVFADDLALYKPSPRRLYIE